MRKIYVIGIGAGDPEYVTVQAIKALNAVNVFFFMDKGEAKRDLIKLREKICQRYIEDRSYRIVEISDPIRDVRVSDYATRVEEWHQQRAIIYEQMIASELEDEQCGAFLVWGDPSVYDSTLRIIDQVLAGGRLCFELRVIPGITSVQALAARHKIVLNEIGESVLMTTGRRLVEAAGAGAENIVVMLDGQCAFKALASQDFYIYWGAYLGMEQEVSLSGPLHEMAERIERVRKDLRERHGWIMDTYVLCRRQQVKE